MGSLSATPANHSVFRAAHPRRLSPIPPAIASRRERAQRGSRRLESNRFSRLGNIGHEDVFLTSGVRYTVGRWAVCHHLDVFSLARFSALDTKALDEFSRRCYCQACRALAGLSPLHGTNIIWCSFAVAIVPAPDQEVVEILRQWKIRHRSGLVPGTPDTYEIPVLYDSITGDLHYFQRIPFMFGNAVYRACHETINSFLLS